MVNRKFDNRNALLAVYEVPWRQELFRFDWKLDRYALRISAFYILSIIKNKASHLSFVLFLPCTFLWQCLRNSNDVSEKP
jgi:hypothetical protein